MIMQLKTSVEEIGPNKVAMTVEVPREDVAEAYNNFFKRAAKTIKIPGFRPGKAPRDLLVKYIGPDEIREQVSEELVNMTYPDAVKQASLQPVSDFTIEDSNLKEGENFTFKATFDICPKIGDIDYKGHTVTVQRIMIDEEMVDKVLERQREQLAKTVTIDDGELQFNDYFMGSTTISYEGKTIEELSEETGYHKFTENDTLYLPIKGMKTGETRSFTYVADQTSEKWADYAGKELEVTVKIDRISRPVVPPLDDELAKQIGGCGTLAELRVQIRERLEKQALSDAEERAVDEILKEIVNATTIDLPNSMVERTIDYYVADIDRRWRRFNSDLNEFLKQTGKDYKAFREELRKKAEFDTKEMLIVDEIGKREGIEVSDSDFRAEVESLAADYGIAVDALMERLSKNDEDKTLRNTIRDRLIRKFLLNNNTVNYDMVKEAESNKGDNAQ